MTELYLYPPTDDARWLAEVLAASAPAEAAWLNHSAYHFLRTRPAQQHPAYGVALLLRRRVEAHLGSRLPEAFASALSALDRAGPTGARFARRVIELWLAGGDLMAGAQTEHRNRPSECPSEVGRRLEEEVLGAPAGRLPSDERLAEIAATRDVHAGEARALAALELFAREALAADEVLGQLAPEMFGDATLDGPVALPLVTRRLLGDGPSDFLYTPPVTSALGVVLDRLREKAARQLNGAPHSLEALQIVASCARLRPEELLPLARHGIALPPGSPARPPLPDEMVDPLADGDAETAVRVALRFPELAGAAEAAQGLTGLTAWVSACLVPVRSLVVRHRAEGEARWEAWTGARPCDAEPSSPRLRLLRALRTGEPIARDEALCWLAEKQWGVDCLLFDSPSGPGWLDASGQLSNPLRSWPAPPSLVLTHPIDLVAAERRAWQLRALQRGRAPFNQLFRECHAPPREERSRRAVDARVTMAALDRLAPAGWFPLISPVECVPELDLGEVRARLLLELGAGCWSFRGIDFLARGRPTGASRVPPRLHSEAWRDLHEALALHDQAPKWQAVAGRMELLEALEPRLEIGPLRIEADHVACRDDATGKRIALGNALPSSGEVLGEAEARALAHLVLPFEDDGGVAPVLVGRLMHLRRKSA